MTTLSPESPLERLQWRYAVKKFDKGRIIAPEVWSTLEQALVLTPSSYGLQPWKFCIVTDAALRARLLPVSWGQSQITDASHLVVFARKLQVSKEDVDAYIKRIATVRSVSEESLAGYREMMIETITATGFDVAGWTGRQVYIALGNFLNSAAVLGVDACPMEGVEREKYDEILGLKKLGFATMCVATAGYRAADDKYAAAPKVRFESAQVIQRF